MPKRQRQLILLVIAILLIALGGFVAYSYMLNPHQTNDKLTAPSQTSDSRTTQTEKTSEKGYSGDRVSVANQFTIKVPNGWQASISEASGFKAVMFARPEQLSSLNYQVGQEASISRSGIDSWSGLTEHFFVLAADAPQTFNPDEHQEISSESFTFDDGVIGSKYLVVKHAEEAAKWGGLLRDNEWQGRTYIYAREGKQIEAHIALYPSAKLDIPFFESVIRTISTTE